MIAVPSRVFGVRSFHEKACQVSAWIMAGVGHQHLMPHRLKLDAHPPRMASHFQHHPVGSGQSHLTLKDFKQIAIAAHGLHSLLW